MSEQQTATEVIRMATDFLKIIAEWALKRELSPTEQMMMTMKKYIDDGGYAQIVPNIPAEEVPYIQAMLADKGIPFAIMQSSDPNYPNLLCQPEHTEEVYDVIMKVRSADLTNTRCTLQTSELWAAYENLNIKSATVINTKDSNMGAVLHKKLTKYNIPHGDDNYDTVIGASAKLVTEEGGVSAALKDLALHSIRTTTHHDEKKHAFSNAEIRAYATARAEQEAYDAQTLDFVASVVSGESKKGETFYMVCGDNAFHNNMIKFSEGQLKYMEYNPKEGYVEQELRFENATKSQIAANLAEYGDQIESQIIIKDSVFKAHLDGYNDFDSFTKAEGQKNLLDKQEQMKGFEGYKKRPEIPESCQEMVKTTNFLQDLTDQIRAETVPFIIKVNPEKSQEELFEILKDRTIEEYDEIISGKKDSVIIGRTGEVHVFTDKERLALAELKTAFTEEAEAPFTLLAKSETLINDLRPKFQERELYPIEVKLMEAKKDSIKKRIFDLQKESKSIIKQHDEKVDAIFEKYYGKNNGAQLKRGTIIKDKSPYVSKTQTKQALEDIKKNFEILPPDAKKIYNMHSVEVMKDLEELYYSEAAIHDAISDLESEYNNLDKTIAKEKEKAKANAKGIDKSKTQNTQQEQSTTQEYAGEEIDFNPAQG